MIELWNIAKKSHSIPQHYLSCFNFPSKIFLANADTKVSEVPVND
jgi:hypothetical protein